MKNTFAPVPQHGYLADDDDHMQHLPTYKGNVNEEAIPREVRAARRNAAAALALSLSVFGLSLALVLRTAPASAGSGASPSESPSNAVIGLHAAEPMQTPQGSLLLDGFSTADDTNDEEGHGILHPPYHLLADSVLRRHASEDGEAVRQMQQGTQIFPLKYRGAWVEVVVPKGEDGSDAAFGWLPLQEEGAALLERDHIARNRPAGPRQPPPSDEEMRQRWDEVRAKNEELKQQLSELQKGVKGTLAHHVGSTRSTVASGAKEVVNIGELRKMVAQVRNGVHKELKHSPEAMLKDLEHAIEE